MVCEELIKQMEKQLGRKLTSKEKRAIEEKMHHNEMHEHPKEEEAIAC